MPSAARTAHACLASIMAEPIWPVSRPLDVTDAEQFPNMAEASRHLASLSAERRAQLEKEWNDG